MCFRKLEIFQGGAAIHRCVRGLGGEKIGGHPRDLTYNHPTPVGYATDRINIGMQSSRDIASEWQVSLPPRVGVQNLFSSAGKYPLQCAAAPVSLRLATALITCPPSPGGTAGEEAIGRRSQPLPRVPFRVDTWWCQGMLVILTLFLPGTEVEIRWRGWQCHLPSNRLPSIRRVASSFGRSHSRSEARGSDITYAGTQDIWPRHVASRRAKQFPLQANDRDM